MKTYRRSGGIAPLILYLGVILLLCYRYGQLPIRGQAFVRGLLLILPRICGYLQHPETGGSHPQSEDAPSSDNKGPTKHGVLAYIEWNFK